MDTIDRVLSHLGTHKSNGNGYRAHCPAHDDKHPSLDVTEAADGTVLVNNAMAESVDEARAIGQDHVPLALDMAPVQPHSAQRKARTCESCHNNPKAMGLGISGGVFQARNATPLVEDLIDQRTGELLPENFQIQITGIPGLDFDWSRIVNEDGIQLQTVGTHWPLSRALNKGERTGLIRTGLCMGCHQEMSDDELWNAVSTAGRLNDEQHIELMNKMIKAYRESLRK